VCGVCMCGVCVYVVCVCVSVEMDYVKNTFFQTIYISHY